MNLTNFDTLSKSIKDAIHIHIDRQLEQQAARHAQQAIDTTSSPREAGGEETRAKDQEPRNSDISSPAQMAQSTTQAFQGV